MNSWRFLFRNLCPGFNSNAKLLYTTSQQIFSQQIRSIFVFVILYLITLFPTLYTYKEPLSHFLILQGLGLINVVINISPIIKEDVQDGFIELWLGNQGLGSYYYIIRQIIVFFTINVPTTILLILFAPSISQLYYDIFFTFSLINMFIMTMWTSSISLLLANSQENSQSLIGMTLAALFLIPQLLIEQAIFESVLTSTIAASQFWLYAGVSIISIALNLILAPTAVRLSVSH